MPYHDANTSYTSSDLNHLATLFENAIFGLVRRYRNHPFAFYTENDLHCYLYHRLYAGGVANGLHETSEGHKTILLHKEYPTAGRYGRGADGVLEPVSSTGRRGAFDLALWNPKGINQRAHRDQAVFCAAELALDECGPKSMHTINDAFKLADKRNGVQHPYLLFFVRNVNAFEKNERKIRRELNHAAKNIRVALVIADDRVKPKPEFLGSWITK